MIVFVNRVTLIALSALVVVPGRARAQGVDPRPANGASLNQQPAFPGQTDAPERKLNVNFEIVTVADSINTGWSVAFLPNGKMLVTQRGGQLLLLGADGSETFEVPLGRPRAVHRLWWSSFDAHLYQLTLRLPEGPPKPLALRIEPARDLIRRNEEE